MRVIIKNKKQGKEPAKKTANKEKKEQDLLIDEVETRAECEKKDGFACYMHPKTEPKPAKTVELKEGVFGLTPMQIQARNRRELNDLLQTADMPLYARLQEVIEDFTEEEFNKLLTSPVAIQRLLYLADR